MNICESCHTDKYAFMEYPIVKAKCDKCGKDNVTCINIPDYKVKDFYKNCARM